MAAACTSSCLREPGEPMIVLLHRCRRGRDDEDVVEGGYWGCKELPRARRPSAKGTSARGGARGRGGGRSPLPCTEGPLGGSPPLVARTPSHGLPRLSDAINRYRRFGFHSLLILLYITYSFHFTVYFFLLVSSLTIVFFSCLLMLLCNICVLHF